jgi:hypothetical protein
MFRTLLVFSLALLLLPLTAYAQNSRKEGPPINPLARQGAGMDVPPLRTEDAANQQLLQNYRKQRELELIRDAEKLHELTGELQDFLNKNGSAVLSVDMLKKAELAEKLAHSVRTRMKDLQ